MTHKPSISETLAQLWPEVQGLTWKDDLRISLLHLLMAVQNPRNGRSVELTIKYYGLDGKPAMTLEEAGATQTPVLTRERVRQVIENVVNLMISKEKELSYKGANPFYMVRSWYKQNITEKERGFSTWEDFKQWGNVSWWGGDEKGLAAFLKDAGIRQVVYRGEKYLYASPERRRGMVQEIQQYNKNQRKKETKAKMEAMAKTVTYVPLSVRDAINKKQATIDMPLNRMYENILDGFSGRKPWKDHVGFFEKTQDLKQKKENKEWVQIGLYISRPHYEQAKINAKETGVSLMAYICRAVAWATSDDPTAKKVCENGKSKI